MVKYSIFIILAIALIHLISCGNALKKDNGDIIKTIGKLQEIVESYQVKESKEFKPFIQFQETMGEFKSDVHFNFFGGPAETEARRVFKIPDSNMFVSSFVAYALLETEKYGTIEISENVIQNAIQYILGFHDSNFPESAPVYTFWPQLYNESTGMHYQYPTNLNDLINEYGGFENLVDTFAKIFKAYGIIKDMSEIASALDGFKEVFHIPSDADDTGCNLALGYLITTLQDKYPNEYQTWQSANSNVSQVFDVYLKYAYRPFSDNLNENMIDERTYYVIREFLEDYKEAGYDQTELILPGTWFTSLTQEVTTENEVMMPFFVNNIDFSVATNSLFGILTSIQANPEAKEYFLQSKDLQNLCLSVSKIIEYGVNTGIVYNRSDLALLYYPSIYDFTWFVSRIIYNLEEINQTSSNGLPYPLNEILQTLTNTMQNNGTAHILSKQKDSQYWDDFLGDADTNIFGKSVQYGEDRFFSTALAVNALIDIWTLPNPTSPNSLRKWRDSTPQQVIEAIDAASNYINDNILDNKEQTSNAFFSGSVKSSQTLAFFYPANFCEYFNGTICDAENFIPTTDVIAGMSGLVSPQQYDTYLSETWCNQTVPVTFPGYNFQPFPYWASNSLSYSISMLALTKYQDLEF